MDTKDTEQKTIKVKLSTKEKLKEYGNFGESYDDVILRLMKINKRLGRMEI